MCVDCLGLPQVDTLDHLQSILRLLCLYRRVAPASMRDHVLDLAGLLEGTRSDMLRCWLSTTWETRRATTGCPRVSGRVRYPPDRLDERGQLLALVQIAWCVGCLGLPQVDTLEPAGQLLALVRLLGWKRSVTGSCQIAWMKEVSYWLLSDCLDERGQLLAFCACTDVLTSGLISQLGSLGWKRSVTGSCQIAWMKEVSYWLLTDRLDERGQLLALVRLLGWKRSVTGSCQIAWMKEVSYWLLSDCLDERGQLLALVRLLGWKRSVTGSCNVVTIQLWKCLNCN